MRLFAWKAMLLPVVLTACSSAIVSNSNQDTDADFANYRTFGWDEPLNKAAPQSYNPLVNNSLVEKQVKQAIRKEMEGFGYRFDQSSPDLLVNFHTLMESRSEIASAYPQYYYFWWRNDIRTINYKESTLIIDLIDATSDQLVWQGFDIGTLNKSKIGPSLQDAVTRILGRYPHRAANWDEHAGVPGT